MVFTDPNIVVVIKLNTKQEENWRYQGQIIARGKTSLLIEAFFNRSDLLFHDIFLRENDRFLERYYEDQWFNIFEIHDREDDRLKGWYCNVTTPAKFKPGKLSYIDLALDLLVYPDSRYLILDQAEFDALNLTEEVRQKALQGLDRLKALAEAGLLVTAIHNDKETR